MKKLLTLAIAAGIYTTASSQLYIQGGANFANITKNEPGATQDNNTLTTFNAGILNRFNVNEFFAVETGLLADGRGAKSDTYFTDSRDDNYVKTKINPIYLKLPVNAVAKFPLMNDMNVFVYAGPYAAMGIGGKSKWEAKALGVSTSGSDNIEFNNDDPLTDEQEGARYDRLKRFDLGLDFGAGVDLGKIMIKANYGLGLNKINSTETDNSDNKNKYRTWSLSLGIPLTKF